MKHVSIILHLILAGLFLPSMANVVPAFNFFSAHDNGIDQFVLFNSSIRVSRDFNGTSGTLAIVAKKKSYILDIYYICSASMCTRTSLNIRKDLRYGSFITDMQPTYSPTQCSSHPIANGSIRLFAVDIQESIRKMLPSGSAECDGESKANIAIAYKNFLNPDTEKIVKTCVANAHPANLLYFNGLQTLREAQNISPSFSFACNYDTNAPRISELAVPQNCVTAKAPIPSDPCLNVPLVAHEYSHFVDLKMPDSVAVAVEHCYSKAFHCPPATKALASVAVSNGLVVEKNTASVDSTTDQIIPADLQNFNRTGSSPPLSIWNQALGLISRAEGSVRQQYGETPFAGKTQPLASNNTADTEVKRPSAVNYLSSGEASRPVKNELDSTKMRANIKASDKTDVATSTDRIGEARRRDPANSIDNSNVSGSDIQPKVKTPKKSGAREIASVSSDTISQTESLAFLSKIESSLARAKTKSQLLELSEKLKRQAIFVRLNKQNAGLLGSDNLGDFKTAKQKFLQKESGKIEIN